MSISSPSSFSPFVVAMAFRLGVMAVLGVMASAGCDSTPSPEPVRPSGVTPAPSSEPAAKPTKTTRADCKQLRETVVEEAAKISGCSQDSDCAVHRTVLCDFPELDCHAAHVNTSHSTGPLDRAIRAYATSCSPSKCKCEVPAESVCRAGKCVAP